uniref:F-box protein 46 n=1 Tax=Neogobius melanostomus TaxID=47308 RepID=A0A8C6S9R4_9GOBI
MERDTFSHIRLWCPRPFGTYSQNKARSAAAVSAAGRVPGRGASEPGPAPSLCPATAPSPAGTQMEDGRVLLDTWYVIKPGNTKEKIAFFVAHQFSGAGQARPSAMKVKGNWATDCSKAKRRRRCSSYDPPTRSSPPPPSSPLDREDSPALTQDPAPLSDLLSVAEMVALVEQRTTLALQERQDSASPIQTDQELEEQQETCRVAQAIARFESQNLENRLHLGHGIDSSKDKDDGAKGACSGMATPPPPPTHSHGEVRIAFRVSNMDSRVTLEPAGRSRCMFMTCGGSAQSGACSKEKITCDLYQLVSPSSRDPGKGGDSNADTNSPNASDAKAEHGAAEKKSRERVTGFHVEVVVTGAVDQCVFYGKDGTENVQEETVCFAVPPGDQSDDPPPGQLFFLQRDEEDPGAAGKTKDCVNNSPAGNESARPESPIVTDDHGDSSLCRLYRHVSHDFLEIRFQIQRLLEPRQYMLLLPDHIMVNIFSYLPTRSLAALKCTCHYFKALIETYGVRAVDSRWTQDPLYRDDPCKQCKRQYERGDVSLCRWHPKPYHHDLPYGRSYWMCCRRTDKDTPGCRVGLHDNNWVQSTAEGAGLRARREERREEAR